MSARIEQRQSPIHGQGVFAAEDLAEGIEVVEYTGGLISHDEADRLYADTTQTGHTFLFTLNDDYVIDGNQGGNIARWINHSCDPNCQAVVEESESGDSRKDRVLIESLRPISAGEELSYDYRIEIGERLTPTLKRIWACHCGADNCHGSMILPKHLRRRKAAG